ncbi:hypothetical protein SAMN04488054_102217 [Salibacterium qingdaonense]|uniref:Uncharacterized protein n=1 Tax=Salibacterium qingdaonense TaxID=266892 RepID=A0A1I4ISX0_9BACI|nr:hypothetical protein SAMN04488054_102217 [Salibacterium qingdaonense]
MAAPRNLPIIVRNRIPVRSEISRSPSVEGSPFNTVMTGAAHIRVNGTVPQFFGQGIIIIQIVYRITDYTFYFHTIPPDTSL